MIYNAESARRCSGSSEVCRPFGVVRVDPRDDPGFRAGNGSTKLGSEIVQAAACSLMFDIFADRSHHDSLDA